MTVIVGMVQGMDVYMGCDSAISCDYEIHSLIDSKIIKKQIGDYNILIGVTGTLRGLQLLKYQWDAPEHLKGTTGEEYIYRYVVNSIKQTFIDHGYSLKFDDQDNQGDNYLIGYKGNIYGLDTNYQVFQVGKPYMAIGSGSQYAYGSLKTQEELRLLGKDPEENIKRAINTATEFCSSVQGPINVYSA